MTTWKLCGGPVVFCSVFASLQLAWDATSSNGLQSVSRKSENWKRRTDWCLHPSEGR